MGLDLPPHPIAAALNTGTGAWSCTFDKLLQPGVLNPVNWSMRGTGDIWLPTSASAAGPTVSGASAISIPNAGPDVINYAAVVPDVCSLSGLPAAAFPAFPLTVT